MRLSVARRVEAPVDTVRTVLCAPGSWGFLPGCEGITPTDSGSEVQLVLRGPRRMAVRLAVEPTPHGCRATLVEGDLKDLRVRVSADPADEGAEVTLELELDAPLAVPGCLFAELEQVTAPRWLDALAEAVEAAAGAATEA